MVANMAKLQTRFARKDLTPNILSVVSLSSIIIYLFNKWDKIAKVSHFELNKE